MSSITISFIVFACVFGGALLVILLRAVLPQNHLSAESKDIVKLGMGLVGTMAALVLGLLVASAKGSYDAQIGELTQGSTNILLLDRLLAQYGPETKEARALLRAAVVRVLDQTWPKVALPLPDCRRRPRPPLKLFTAKSRAFRRKTARNARCRARR